MQYCMLCSDCLIVHVHMVTILLISMLGIRYRSTSSGLYSLANQRSIYVGYHFPHLRLISYNPVCERTKRPEAFGRGGDLETFEVP